jgi:hypothetical protein
MGDALSQVVIVAFDLGGAQAKNLPKLLNDSIQSKPVQRAIREGLQTFALKKVASGTTTVSDAQAKNFSPCLRRLVVKLATRFRRRSRRVRN